MPRCSHDQTWYGVWLYLSVYPTRYSVDRFREHRKYPVPFPFPENQFYAFQWGSYCILERFSASYLLSGHMFVMLLSSYMGLNGKFTGWYRKIREYFPCTCVRYGKHKDVRDENGNIPRCQSMCGMENGKSHFATGQEENGISVPPCPVPAGKFLPVPNPGFFCISSFLYYVRIDGVQ